MIVPKIKVSGDASLTRRSVLLSSGLSQLPQTIPKYLTPFPKDTVEPCSRAQSRHDVERFEVFDTERRQLGAQRQSLAHATTYVISRLHDCKETLAFLTGA